MLASLAWAAGHDLARPSTRTERQKAVTRLAACPNCAAPLRDGLRFCTQCGTPLRAVTDARVEPVTSVTAPKSPAPPVSAATVTAVAPDFDIATDFGDDAVDDPGPVFEPVPALGSLASAPAERPSILGLLVDHGAGATLAASPRTAAEVEAELEAENETAPERTAAFTPAPEPATETELEHQPAPEPSHDASAVEIHPLGVPVISARRPLGPGADPTHIGRASAYAAGAARVGSTATATATAAPESASPTSASPAVHFSAAVATPSPVSPTSASAASPAVGSPDAPASPSEGTESRATAPARAPRRYTPPPARSRAATWALVTGMLPLAVSIAGNLVTAELGRQALAATEAGVTSGAWAPVFVALSLVFVINAALLTVCAISGTRGIRETANGVTKGRALAVAGLAAGAVNLVLLVAGLAITISGLSTVLA